MARLGKRVQHLLQCLGVLVLLSSCGGGDGGDAEWSAPAPQWLTVDSVVLSSPTSARISGTAWISQSYVGLHCVGLACLFDQSTDNYPGVNVSWMNQTTGGSGSATSYYGGGTDWQHQWTAGVALAPGVNTVTFSAFDPGGTGGSITQVINGTLAVSLTIPANGASNVAVNSAIAVSFNSPLDPSSVSPASISLSGPGGSVAGSYAVNGSTITFAPASLLSANTSYTARVAAGIRDSGGFALPADFSWSFTTGSNVGTLFGVWGSSAYDIFAVGAGGTILHYDGARWAAMPSGTTSDLYSVWGSAPGDVYAVGALGTILHYDGAAWAPMSSGVTNWLRGIWGSSARDVFTVDASGTILHYDGSAWSSMSTDAGRNLFAVWGSAPTNVLAVGMLGSDIAPPGGTCGYFCAYQLIERYDGSQWSTMSPYRATPYLSPYDITTSGILYGIWGSAANNVYAVGSGSILHYDGSSWVSMSSGSAGALYAVWGIAANKVYAVGDDGTILQYDGSAWSTSPSPTTVRLTGVWGSAAADVYAVGYGALLHYDGNSWQLVHPGP